MTNINPISSFKEELFEPLSHYGFVTSLKIYSNYVVAGYGSILKVFSVEKDDVSLIFSSQIFKRNKIHHISFSEKGEKLCVSGGRSFKVIEFDSLVRKQYDYKIDEKAINEWIISTEFLNESTLLVLTSHNVIYKVDVSSSVGHYSVLDMIHCNEKSILYSGSIRILADKTVLISAGTVMNGVILWNLNTRQILHNLTEHEGSIFGVKVDQNGKYIISCSDDRSVKLYELKTGELLATGWGHGSRIWNLEFFKDTSDGSVKIFSTGEDCTARLWEYQPGNSLLTQLELWDNCHLGKHIWSGDVDDKFLKLCVTGGADGKIRVHDLANRGTSLSYTPQQISELLSKVFGKNEAIQLFCELSNLNLLVSLTSNGNILTLDQNTSTWHQISLCEQDVTQLKDFGLITACSVSNTALICCRNGDVLCLNFKDAHTVEKNWIRQTHGTSNKVINFLGFTSSNNFYALIDFPNPKMPFILLTFTLSNEMITLESSKQLNKPNQNVFTTTDILVDEINNWLVIGSRFTSIAVYDLNNLNDSLELGAIFKKICPGDTISSVSIVETFKDKITILMTVKDGVYMYANLLKDQSNTFSLDIFHQNKISRGFIEGGFVKNMDLIVYGFKSSYFYVWNETKQLEITNELCGGAHRKWLLIPYSNRNPVDLDYKFIYMSKSTLQIKSFKGRFNHQNYGLIHEGTHGREIRDISVSKYAEKDGSKLIISASEDTTLRLGKLYSNGSIENFWSLNNHVSGLQKVKFISKDFAASSAANEEFLIWKLNYLSNGFPAIIEYSRLKPKSDIPDLRIMDFDTLEVENGFIISTVYSDSNIKIMHFNSKTKVFTPLADDYYTKCCILNVNFLKFNEKSYIMIGATDGYLTIWEVTSILNSFPTKETASVAKFGKMIIKQQLHQNGIKAIQVSSSENGYNIVTGGDDNSLILNTLFLLNAEELILESKSFVESAASATLTSLSSGGPNRVVSTSVDQIVRLWSVENGKLECESARYTTIADTGSSDYVDFDGENMIVLAGAGLSTWSFK
ncbi:WD40 repeat-like protein [Hyphopichia burtonii NRRL Y-1933]|uniref:WD40 repeat-like protein n=1 Tax=Hyphopichia burtonii NRRL Y-1933 TaxID=984485 RepID=A0A1E4RD82_9ASCO|nr:WD40 repeat-like protein [Hyphopichia burtonii NRRL Y-1933]ODV65218.1 WD40 repeat-like protein [Hyphopichia burtonii NRRL Y-1933]